MRNRDEDELSDILIDDDEDEKETKGRSKKIFLIVAMAVILLLVVVFAIYALTREETPKQPQGPLAPAPSQPTGLGGDFAQPPTTAPAVPSKDKFEDIIARIKNEQPKPEIPAKPSSQQPTNVAPPPGTGGDDLQSLFKPQTPAPAPTPTPTPEPTPQIPAPAPSTTTPPVTPPPAVPKPAPTASETPKPAAPPKIVDVASDPNGSFFIQAASVSRFSEDSDFAKKIKSHQLPYRVQEENVNYKTVYRVLIGPYGSKADAHKVLSTVRYYLEKEAFIKQVN